MCKVLITMPYHYSVHSNFLADSPSDILKPVIKYIKDNIFNKHLRVRCVNTHLSSHLYTNNWWLPI